LDDREERVSGQKRGLVGLGVNDDRLGRHRIEVRQLKRIRCLGQRKRHAFGDVGAIEVGFKMRVAATNIEVGFLSPDP
jgi:hypothetical protein